MRRFVVAMGVLGLLVVTAVPVAAGAVEKTTYWGAECNFLPTGPPERAWAADGTEHIRGLPAAAEEWVFHDGAWVQEGSNATLVNVNATPSGDHLWGTFMYRSGIVGDFDGSFQLNPMGGKAHGQGVGDSAGDVVKVTLNAMLPDDIPPAPAGCGVIKLVVFDH